MAANPNKPVKLVRPLVIRANVDDEIDVRFENQLSTSASIYMQRAEYDVQTSDGAWVGKNANSTTAPGNTRYYRWRVLEEGIHLFTDMANPLASEQGSHLHGLFGALIVEPRGATWTDPTTGGALSSGPEADVHHPLLPSFREFVWFFHDEMAILDINGQTPDRPGFPNFIPGTIGKKAPRPPLGIDGGRAPTSLEQNQFAANARPGAVFVNP